MLVIHCLSNCYCNPENRCYSYIVLGKENLFQSQTFGIFPRIIYPRQNCLANLSENNRICFEGDLNVNSNYLLSKVLWEPQQTYKTYF